MILRYHKMLEHQERIRPFPPTMDELRELWDLKSKSSVENTLHHLIRMGLVVYRENGSHSQYYAIEKN